MAVVMAVRDFRLLWIGQGTSFLGDQFATIALPWLVLQLTGDPLALGVMLASLGIPRAVSMVFGGAVSDRLSARAVMLVSDVARLLLMLALVLLTAAGAVRLWMIYILAASFGAASGFFMPASNSIVPTLVDREHLAAGNAIFQGTTQLSQFIGPAIAGSVIAWFTKDLGSSGQQSLTGISIAFAIDALALAVSVLTLWMMAPATFKETTSSRMLEAIRSGVAFLWSDKFLRLSFILLALANLLFAGPLLVGIPVLADSRLAEGALGYGLIMSAFAAGNLAGMVSAGMLPKPKGLVLRYFIPVLLIAFGVTMFSLGWVKTTWAAIAILLPVGVGNGYMQITAYTLLQRRAPARMLGRLISLLLVANFGMVPLSQAISGALSKWSLTGLFAIAGVAMLLLGVWAAFQPEMGEIEAIFNGPPSE
jgi:MFS family permease